MAEGKRRSEVEVSLLGMAVLSALDNMEKGIDGEVDLDLGGRWVRIKADHMREVVLLYVVGTPPGFGRGTQEG